VLIVELARHRRSKLNVTLVNRKKGRAGAKAFIWKIISRQDRIAECQQQSCQN